MNPQMKKKLLIVNNIPTPYRNYMYKCLNEAALKHDIFLTVAFQAEKGISHKRKFKIWWNTKDLLFDFNYFISKNLFGKRRRFHSRWSLNPDIFCHIIRNKYDYVLAPPSMSLFNWIYCKFPLKVKKILYTETNEYANPNTNKVNIAILKWLFNDFNAIAVPGRMAANWIYKINNRLTEKVCLPLPNLIDSRSFDVAKLKLIDKSDLRRRIGIPQEKKIITGIGIAKYKGREQLINSAANVKGEYIILLIGDGDTYDEYDIKIKSSSLEERMRLIGLKNEEEVKQILYISDWFIHTSYWDPSPLALIEAAFLGLPLAVSIQTGNAPELVEENKNGFLFDPLNAQNITDALNRIINTTKEEELAMGQASLDIARKNFDAELISERFISQLITI